MGFEEAHEAIEKELGSGQDGQPKQEVEPSVAPEVVELTELDKLEKFKFEGKEMTLEDLRKQMMLEKDYRNKTRGLAEERKQFATQREQAKFDLNLKADLQAVLDNPQLLQEFKRIYPEQYHFLADNLKIQQQQAADPNAVNPLIDNRLRQIESKYQTQEAKWAEQEKVYHEAQIEAAEASIDVVFGKMSQKYPLADERVVLSQAQALMDQGVKLADDKGTQLEDTWDKIWKTVNDQSQKRYEGYYKKQVDQQKLASSKGKDLASGGGIPDQAPKKIKFKDVADHAIASLNAQRQN